MVVAFMEEHAESQAVQSHPRKSGKSGPCSLMHLLSGLPAGQRATHAVLSPGVLLPAPIPVS